MGKYINQLDEYILRNKKTHATSTDTDSVHSVSNVSTLHSVSAVSVSATPVRKTEHTNNAKPIRDFIIQTTLEAAVSGLPITVEELFNFLDEEDLEEIRTGALKTDALKLVAQTYFTMH